MTSPTTIDPIAAHGPALDEPHERSPQTGDEPPADADAPAASSGQNSAGRLALRTGLGLLILFAVMAAGAVGLKEPLTEAGTWFVAEFGYLGIFIGTVLCDAFGVPIPVDVYLAAAVTANAPHLPVLGVASLASLIGGSLAWFLGRHLERIPLLHRLIARHRLKGEALFARWGVAAVAIAAWTPIPFSIICVMAGAFRMPFKRFFWTTLHRIPRIVLYFYVIILGWSVGG